MKTPEYQIKLAMAQLIEWAKAYEEGETNIPDNIYDAQVRQLVRYEKDYPFDWEVSLKQFPEFTDGSWKYTGAFYHLT